MIGESAVVGESFEEVEGGEYLADWAFYFPHRYAQFNQPLNLILPNKLEFHLISRYHSLWHLNHRLSQFDKFQMYWLVVLDILDRFHKKVEIATELLKYLLDLLVLNKSMRS